MQHSSPTSPRQAAARSKPSAQLVYEPLDFLLVRAPLLPIETYLGLSDQTGGSKLGARPCGTTARETLSLLANDQHVRRALAVGSSSLLAALERSERSALNERVAERVYGKLLRYLIRMSTRPTPYGLFAGVALARWGTKTDLALGVTSGHTRTRPDMEWLLRLVLSLESQPEIRKHLSFVANPAALVRSGRVFLAERAPSAEAGAAQGVTVRATGVVRRALSLARRPIAYRHLVDALCESRPGATLNKVEQLITELWQQTLLLTDLRPPLTTADPARYVSQHLADIPAAGHTLAALEAVLDAASSWDTLPPEEGAAAYRELLNQAKTMIPSPVKTPLQTDMALALNGRHINQDIGTEAARAAELLLRLTPLPDGLPYLTAYRREFVSRYGECREVPLLEVLDSNFGLGSPTAYNTSSAWRVATSKAAGRSQTLLDLACAALRDRRSVVELDAATLSRLETWPPSPDTAPPSMDIYAFVAASSAAAMDAGEFQVIVGPNLGAMAAGRNLARFADMLAPEAETALERAARAEEAQLPRCIWAELVYLPSQLRSANVVIRPAVRTHEIALAVSPGVSASNVIPLDELVLGVRDNRFYVRWPTENTEVAVSAGHMLNHMNAPAVCRFLADVGRDGMPQLSEFDWGTATNFPFLPRIQVGRIVLHPAQWRVSKEYLRPTPPDVFMERLDLWREHWQVPRHVYMSAGDNRLLLDLEDAKQADELRTELRDLQDREQILLQEVLPGFDKVWTNGPGGRFITEFVVSLVRRSNPSSVGVTANATATTSRQSSYAPITYVPAVAQPSQLCPPGSDWLFAKLYCPRDLAEDLIVGPLLTFADDAVSSGWAKKWFFLRYSDPEPHLRLRFQSVPELLSGELLPRLCAWGAELMARDLCLRFGLDTYEREVERYGGPSGVSAAESLFAADSRAVAQLLHLIGRRELQLDRILLAVVSVDDLLMSLRMDEVTRLQWYREQVTSRREVSHEYRQLKSSLRSLVSDPGHLLAQPGGEAAARILAARRAALAPVADRLVGLAEQNELSQPLTTLYRSFVHLHCNRLLGIDLHAERQVLSLLLRTREGLGRAPGALHSAADS